MKYHGGIKLLAFLLAACMLLVMLGSALSIIYLSEQNLYRQSIADWQYNKLESRAIGLSYELLRRYTAQKLGGMTKEQLDHIDRGHSDQTLSEWFNLDPDSWDYWIRDLDGNLMENGVKLMGIDGSYTFTFNQSCDYPIHATPEESARIENTEGWNYRDYYVTETQEHFLYYYDSPNYMVSVRFMPDQLSTYSGISRDVLMFLYNARYMLIAALLLSLALFAGCTVYLCFAAGRTPAEPAPRLRFLCRLPLDLLFCLCGAGAMVLIAGAVVLADDTIFPDPASLSPLAIVVLFAMLYAAACLVLCFIYAAAAQFKQKNGYFWRHSIIGWCLRKIVRFFRFCFRGAKKVFSLLPLIWQWLVTAAAMVLVPFICLLLAINSFGFFLFVFAVWTVGACLADIGLVCYGAYAFGTLYKGAKAMARGDFQSKVPTRYLFGAFRSFAQELNALADAAILAAKSQMKSERMRTELITNVSHDIKTPLTSIINYVDLLRSADTEEARQQYLQVLSRQSDRMKKLVEDLMEMSKASSGNMPVNIQQLDAVETVNQALGEFTDKLASARLNPIFHPTAAPVFIAADGRLAWRVLSNLLSNAVKYAMPGTRLYVDITPLERCVQISMKNISAEPLNVSADELTERFVRGDASRNTEGSGLGLNIAQSLMELQKGSLELLVDGDLFKVTLTFPKA